jgi:glycosyltransferase involved in cell wall biosynthesis
VAQTLGKYQLPQEYLLHVGRIDRKNNLTALVEGYAYFRARRAAGDKIKLVLVGGQYAKNPDPHLGASISRLGLEKEVLLTGRLPNEDLPPLYSGAGAVVISSLHEGFGLAAAEAMACGAPLVAPRRGAIPEVVGEAALLVEQTDPKSLGEAIDRVLYKPELRQRLRRDGPQRAKRFQNPLDAQRTLEIYARTKKNHEAL